MATYLIADQFVATGPRATWDGWQPLGNTAYVCPRCGTLWARVVVGLGQWHFVNHACARCPTHHGETPGSFWLTWHHSQLDEFPLEVLYHEFLRHYDAHLSKE